MQSLQSMRMATSFGLQVLRDYARTGAKEANKDADERTKMRHVVFKGAPKGSASRCAAFVGLFRLVCDDLVQTGRPSTCRKEADLYVLKQTACAKRPFSAHGIVIRQSKRHEAEHCELMQSDIAS